MGKIFATTSGKGGVGKSSTAVGLSLAFARSGLSVLLVDMDEGLGCLDLLLGIAESAVLDLTDALEAEDIKEIAYSCGEENLFLIPAPKRVVNVDGEKLCEFAKKASALYDIVIFDFPAGLDFSLYTALPKTALFLAVSSPDPVCIRDASAVSENLADLGLSSRMIINHFNLKEHKKRKLSSIDDIIDTASIQLLGIIPESEEISLLSIKHNIKKRGKTNKAFMRIAGRLMNKNIPLAKLKKIRS